MPTRRVSSCILPLLLLSLQALSQETDLFSVYYPCSVETVNVSVARECDVFVFSAVELALERIMSQNNNSLINFVSTSTRTNGVFNEETTEILYKLYTEVTEQLQESVGLLRGSLGPAEDSVLGKTVAALAGSAQFPQVSYGLTDSRLNESPGFFRTLPSTLALVNARLSLLRQFKWFRIGLLSSEDLGYQYQMESVSEASRSLPRDNDHPEEQFIISYEDVSTDLQVSLTEIRRANINIILGFFTPAEARTVLCEASSPAYNLTSPGHVWILPAYYSPDWWRGDRDNPYSHQRTNNCTDLEMVDILQSVIFIDPVKFPPMNTSLGDFYEDLLNKTLSLYPELDSREELLPLLLNSRAVSAYDATLLLVNSLNNHSVDTALLRGSMLCELCKMYPANAMTDVHRSYCESISEPCLSQSLRVHNATTLEKDIVSNSYGQVLISQFINGTHCPLVVYWPSLNLTFEGQEFRNFVPTVNLTEASPNGLGLGPLVMSSERANCPKEFVWKGDQLPSYNKLKISTEQISEASLVVVGICTGLLEILIVCLIVFNVVWRNNKHVRPTSPRLNVIMLLSVLVASPLSLLDGIIHSGSDCFIDNTIFPSILCQVNIWVCEIALTFSVYILGGKIRRLYEIFRNKSLKVKKYLGDHYLLSWAVVLVIPEIIWLIAWNAVEPHLFITSFVFDNKNFQMVRYSSCSLNIFSSPLVPIILYSYKIILLFAITGILAMIKGNVGSFKLDLYMTRISFGLSLFFIMIGLFGGFVFSDKLEISWWCRVLQNLVPSAVLVCGLFCYQVVLVFKDYYKSTRLKIVADITTEYMNYRTSLEVEKAKLVASLREKERVIAELKAERELVNTSETLASNISYVRVFVC